MKKKGFKLCVEICEKLSKMRVFSRISDSAKIS